MFGLPIIPIAPALDFEYINLLTTNDIIKITK